jgi:predicted ferric reductase
MWEALDTPRTGSRPHPPAGPAVPPAQANPNAVLTLIIVGAVSAVGLWWASTPSIHGFGDWLTNAGRVLGLLAGYSMVVLLALMARVPSLERGLGSDRLARWHSMGGRYTVSLVVAHGLLILWGYAVTAHTDVVHEGWSLLRSYPDVLMATVAGLLLIGVGISSARAARRRLRYETWYYLHFYTYLAVVLAFSHQFAVGADFIANRAARVYWAALYIGVGLLLVWNRIVRPIRASARHRLRVARVVRESSRAVSLIVAGERLDELQADPGQFFRFRFLTRGLWWSSNPYSLSAPLQGNTMRVTIKDLGDASRLAAQLKPGTRVFAEGPYGAFTAHRRRQRRVVLIAAGVGITPLRTLFETLPIAAPGDLTLVYRVSSHEQVLFRSELEQIAAARGAVLHLIVGSRRELRGDPLAAQWLARLPLIRQSDVYICGPERMRASVTDALRSIGVPRRHIHSESYAF